MSATRVGSSNASVLSRSTWITCSYNYCVLFGRRLGWQALCSHQQERIRFRPHKIEVVQFLRFRAHTTNRAWPAYPSWPAWRTPGTYCVRSGHGCCVAGTHLFRGCGGNYPESPTIGRIRDSVERFYTRSLWPCASSCGQWEAVRKLQLMQLPLWLGRLCASIPELMPTELLFRC